MDKVAETEAPRLYEIVAPQCREIFAIRLLEIMRRREKEAKADAS